MVTHRRLVDVVGDDFYVTPNWCSHALMVLERFNGNILEPCCGNGAISKVIEQYYPGQVKSSDLNNNGYGKVGRDFLKQTKIVDNIITNPPYNIANELVLHALPLVNKKLCLLLRLAFLEGAARHNSIYLNNPPNTIWIFSERVTMFPANNQRITGGTAAFAWFIWEPTLKKPKTRIRWIPPGFKTLIP